VDVAARRLFDGEGSLGNGAAMRIAPIAVLFAERAEDILAAGRTAARRSAMRRQLDQAAALLGSDVGPGAVGELLGNSAIGLESVSEKPRNRPNRPVAAVF
jgi:ADP-ribosylglycohydrolase